LTGTINIAISDGKDIMLYLKKQTPLPSKESNVKIKIHLNLSLMIMPISATSDDRIPTNKNRNNNTIKNPCNIEAGCMEESGK